MSFLFLLGYLHIYITECVVAYLNFLDKLVEILILPHQQLQQNIGLGMNQISHHTFFTVSKREKTEWVGRERSTPSMFGVTFG